MMKLLFPAVWFWIVTTAGAVAIEITSLAFKNGETIPSRYVCEKENGENISPTLAWANCPRTAKSLVLIVEDPDAVGGTYDHWVVFNIPVETVGFAENIEDYPKGALVGKPYTGPCPPDEKVHRYFFKIYALDNILLLKAGATKTEILEAMGGHILEKAELLGLYGKTSKTQNK